MSRYENVKFSVGIDDDAIVIRIRAADGSNLCNIKFPDPDADYLIKRVALMLAVLRKLEEEEEER